MGEVKLLNKGESAKFDCCSAWINRFNYNQYSGEVILPWVRLISTELLLEGTGAKRGWDGSRYEILWIKMQKLKTQF